MKGFIYRLIRIFNNYYMKYDMEENDKLQGLVLKLVESVSKSGETLQNTVSTLSNTSERVISNNERINQLEEQMAEVANQLGFALKMLQENNKSITNLLKIVTDMNSN